MSFKSFAPLFHSFSHNTNLKVEKAQFHNYLSRVIQYDALMFETIREHQNYDDEFSLVLYDCLFDDIHISDGYGGAFVAISDIHTLRIEYSKFFKCTTSGKGFVGSRLTPVGAGAFVFVGGHSDVEFTCFRECSAQSNTQTFHTYIMHSGTNKLIHSYFTNNGGREIKAHTLYSLDAGVAEVNGDNATYNIVPGGYAGGHVGWFAVGSSILYSAWEHNEGKSIFGSCAYGPDSFTFLTFVQFRFNVATRYGVYNRLTGLTKFSSAIFIFNEGLALWGNSPVSLHRAYFDCDRPPGVMEEDTVAWNWPDKRTFHIIVEMDCPLAPKKKSAVTAAPIPDNKESNKAENEKADNK